jgi:hypothetical protein
MKKAEKPTKVNMSDIDLLKVMVKTKPLKKDKVQLPKGIEELTKKLRGK